MTKKKKKEKEMKIIWIMFNRRDHTIYSQVLKRVRRRACRHKRAEERRREGAVRPIAWGTLAPNVLGNLFIPSQHSLSLWMTWGLLYIGIGDRLRDWGIHWIEKQKRKQIKTNKKKKLQLLRFVWHAASKPTMTRRKIRKKKEKKNPLAGWN